MSVESALGVRIDRVESALSQLITHVDALADRQHRLADRIGAVEAALTRR